jgi:hypothetical protein
MTNQITILPQPRREVRRQNTHFFIDQAYKRVDCAKLGNLTTGTMLPLLGEKPQDYRERKRRMRDTMLLLQEPTNNQCEASNI